MKTLIVKRRKFKNAEKLTPVYKDSDTMQSFFLEIFKDSSTASFMSVPPNGWTAKTSYKFLLIIFHSLNIFL